MRTYASITFAWWFKEELDDPCFESLLEAELLLSSISTYHNNKRTEIEPSVNLKSNVDAPFASQSRIPEPRKGNTRRERVYANVMATSREAASLTETDPEDDRGYRQYESGVSDNCGEMMALMIPMESSVLRLGGREEEERRCA